MVPGFEAGFVACCASHSAVDMQHFMPNADTSEAHTTRIAAQYPCAAGTTSHQAAAEHPQGRHRMFHSMLMVPSEVLQRARRTIIAHLVCPALCAPSANAWNISVCRRAQRHAHAGFGRSRLCMSAIAHWHCTGFACRTSSRSARSRARRWRRSTRVWTWTGSPPTRCHAPLRLAPYTDTAVL